MFEISISTTVVIIAINMKMTITFNCIVFTIGTFFSRVYYIYLYTYYFSAYSNKTIKISVSKILDETSELDLVLCTEV